MGTPIKKTENLDEFMKRRRQMLLENSDIEEDTVSISAANENTAPVSDGMLLKVLKKSAIGAKKYYDWQEGVGEKIEGSLKNTMQKTDAGLPSELEPLGISPDAAVGMAFGATAIQGTVPVIRKLSPFRIKGSKLVKEVEKVRKQTGTMSATKVGLKLHDYGYNFWSKTLDGLNPSQFGRKVVKIPPGKWYHVQRGMLESLSENIANAPRITSQMQKNLLSPAGRARLAATFDGMPPEVMANFIRLVERGEWQNLSRWTLAVAVGFPVLRKLGRSGLEILGLD